MKFVGKERATQIWGLMKDHVAAVKTALEAAIKDSQGTLSDEIEKKQDKLVSGTNIKTVNGESLLGSGNVAIDLSLYKVVTELPTEDIDENKIYLVSNGQTEGNNVYTEYMYVDSKWEVTGEYQSSVDLTPYAKTADVNEALALKADASSVYTKSEVDTKETALKAVATTTTDGMMSYGDKTKLNGIASGAQANVIETVKVDGTALAVTGKAVNIDLSGKVDKESGKQLSTNDFTAAYKTKLDGIADNATADEELTEAEIAAICV